MSQSFEFSSETASQVSWKATIAFNMVRMLIGALLLTFVLFLTQPEYPAMGMLIGPPAAAIGWLIVGLPVWFICQKLPGNAKGIAALLFVLPFLVVGIAGDPILFIASKFKPGLLPVEKPSFITFSAVIFVLKNGR